jgi:cell division protein FtsA
MFESPHILVGLEIGTAKICAMVGEINPSGVLTIIGVGQAHSRGVRKGEISDATAAEEDIRKALADAEMMANVEIRSVYLGVTGSHIRGFNNHGAHHIASADREITGEDVQDVIKIAKAINLPQDHVILHSIRQHFTVDGQTNVIDPERFVGAKLELDMHVIHGNINRVQNPVRVVKGMQLEVEQVVFNGMASSLSLLTSDEKEMGALVIDIGGGTTEYVVHAEGVIKHSGVLALGGDHVSNDLAYGLKVPLGRAEKLKIAEGSALMDDSVKGRTLSLESEVGLPARTINLGHLRRIMGLRLEEIFLLIEEDLSKQGLLDYIRAGLFLSGGGAKIPGIDQLASRILRMPATLGKANALSGLKSALDQPEFATAIGLVKFGALHQHRQTPNSFLPKVLKSTLGGIFRR